MLNVFPTLEDVAIDYAWGGTLAITLNRMPHLGQLRRRTYFAQGFSGQGLALAGMAGQLMAEAILGESDDFECLAGLDIPHFPGGVLLRNPIRMAAMLYGALKDAS
jgi:gamma-glutamylputrescine oxidase